MRIIGIHFKAYKLYTLMVSKLLKKLGLIPTESLSFHIDTKRFYFYSYLALVETK